MNNPTVTDHRGSAHVPGTSPLRCPACSAEKRDFFGGDYADPIAAANWRNLLIRRIKAAR